MTKAEAKKLVFGVVAATLYNDLEGIGAGWIFESDTGDEPRPDADVKRIAEAIEEFVREMERRCGSDLRRRFPVRR